ncbi:MAG: hypothetical protein AB7K09_19380 [Planctomycetota bacterium]
MTTTRTGLAALALMLTVAMTLTAGCGPAADNAASKPHAGHHHEAPHGGTLFVIGGDAHAAHLEFVLDGSTGTLTMYLLDGHAEPGELYRLKEADVPVTISEIKYKGDRAAAGELPLKLAAVASEGTGETVGNTSQFAVTHELLKEAVDFTIDIASLTIKGTQVGPLKVPFPEGNEEGAGDHDHDHDHHDH